MKTSAERKSASPIHHPIDIFPSERQKLYERFEDRIETAFHLNRQTVSFQANKDEPIHRWFKYKEGFSSGLVKYFLNKYSTKPGRLLDPFAGVGTTLFAGQAIGWEGIGIEVLPVGIFVMQARDLLPKIDLTLLRDSIQHFWSTFDKIDSYRSHYNHIAITRDAFPDDTESALNKFLTYCESINRSEIQTALRFAALTILEEISYTRKDGQYLRWDYRSKRDLSGKPFNKGKIHSFEQALRQKLNQIVSDLAPHSYSLFDTPMNNGSLSSPINVIEGSCLENLPRLENDSFDFIITSPPYCNRYDYTRTYALELVFLGCDSMRVRNLRQELLSCTVENKAKVEQLSNIYDNYGKRDSFDFVLHVYDSSAAMKEINVVLNQLDKLDELNNSNVPRMVRNYFLEMCFVIYEMARVMKAGGHCVMVNDNVRYGGEEVPVDLILSEFAEAFGFKAKKIFVLPRGKGNSSQQMGHFGRTEIRKCVYLWQKL